MGMRTSMSVCIMMPLGLALVTHCDKDYGLHRQYMNQTISLQHLHHMHLLPKAQLGQHQLNAMRIAATACRLHFCEL